MGKLIRNGIEYGGGNGTDIFEVTQAEYDALVQAGTLVHNALYVITDAPNLNETAQNISYDGSTDTVYDVLKITDITNDYITMASGYSFTSGKVYKQGKHIFGNIVLNGTLQGGNNSDTLGIIKSDYRTAEPVNGFCGVSNGQWFTNNIGYVYIAVGGGLQVATTPTGMTYAKIHIDYVTA